MAFEPTTLPETAHTQRAQGGKSCFISFCIPRSKVLSTKQPNFCLFRTSVPFALISDPLLRAGSVLLHAYIIILMHMCITWTSLWQQDCCAKVRKISPHRRSYKWKGYPKHFVSVRAVKNAVRTFDSRNCELRSHVYCACIHVKEKQQENN